MHPIELLALLVLVRYRHWLRDLWESKKPEEEDDMWAPGAGLDYPQKEEKRPHLRVVK